MTKHEFPKRRAFGPDERTLIEAAMLSFELSGDDPHYQRMYEKNYTDLFCHLQDGGYADAVASGTAAVFIAVKALDLPPGSTVLCSPITDAGTLSAIILAGHKVKLVDAVPDTYNIDDNSIEVACHECRKEKTAPEALVVVHSLGTAARVSSNWTDEIMVVEDCSQAHLARYLDDDSLVGTRGDISAFSTMARKAHISGGCGGLVYTRDLHLHRRALAHAEPAAGLQNHPGAFRAAVEPLVLMVAPLAPHLAEELWQRLGHDTSLAHGPFPVADDAYLTVDTVEYPVQVNGKVRGHITVHADADADTLEAAALADEKVQAFLNSATPKKVIVVAGRLVNLVV
jgi:hypothetical protein